MNSYSTITLQYPAADSLWHVVSRYNEIGGTSGEHWTVAGNHIINTNSGNVGINVVEPLSRLSIDGELALMSDTIILPCAISMNQLKPLTTPTKEVSHPFGGRQQLRLFTTCYNGYNRGNDGRNYPPFTHQ